MKRNIALCGSGVRGLVSHATAKRGTARRAAAARCGVEPLETRVLFAVTTETFTNGKGPFSTTFEHFSGALHPRGISDGSETLRLNTSASFQSLDFKVRHNGGSGSVTRMRLIGYSAGNAIIYDNQFNTPPSTTVTIPVNTKVARLEFQPITVLANGQQFVGSGVLRTVLDDFRYDPVVAANSPPQLTGMGAGQIGSYRENGQVSIFANPAQGINASVQDSDDDTVTVEVQADDADRGLLVGLDQDGDGKYFLPVSGQPGLLRLVGTPAEATRAIREVYLYLANVDDVTDTGRDFTTTFTVRINDGTNPVVTTAAARGVIHGINEAPTITSTAAAAALLNQRTYDRDTITPFATFTVDDPDNKPVLPSGDVLPDTLHLDVRFPDANGTLVGTGWTKTGVSGGIATWRYTGNHSQVTTAVRTVAFNPTDKFAPGAVTTTNFTLKVTDQGDPTDNDPVRGASLSFTFGTAVSVAAKTNTSPVLGGGAITRPAILESAASPAITVASLVASPNAMTDADTDQRRGIAVVAATGGWQYSPNNGTSWHNFNAVSPTAALVLDATTQVRFASGFEANGLVWFTYKAWDRSSWLTNVGGTASSNTARVRVDASQYSAAPQNVSPFSQASVTLNQPITAVNDAPNVVNGNTVNLAPVAEDTAGPAGRTVASLYAANFSDSDDNQGIFINGSAANLFAGVAVTGNPEISAKGAWQYSSDGGANWVNIGTAVSDAAALLLAGDARVRFVPAPNFNGAATALTVRLVDDSGAALVSGTTANVSVNGDPTRYSAATIATSQTITPVNDAPTLASLSAGPNPVTAPQAVTLTAAAVADADGAGDVANVKFYRESNGAAGLQTGSGGDTLVGTDASAAGGWTVNSATSDLASGTYTYYAQAADAAGATSDAASTTVAVENPDTAPLVEQVYVRGASWAGAFLASLAAAQIGSAADGFAIVGGPAQYDGLPWTNLDQVRVKFSEAVTIDAAAVAVATNGAAGLAVTAVSFDAATLVATITLSRPLSNEQVMLTVRGTGAGAVADTDGAATALDGEWTNPTAANPPTGGDAFPSGDGIAGGDFQFKFNALPGDVNRSGGIVNSQDMQQVRLRQFTSPAEPGTAPNTYSAFHDVNGNGAIDAADVQQVRLRQFSELPTGNPASAASLFGSTPIHEGHGASASADEADALAAALA